MVLLLLYILAYVFCRHIQHPNVLSLLGAIQSERRITIVTNYVNGMDLHTLIFDTAVERVSIIAVSDSQ